MPFHRLYPVLLQDSVRAQLSALRHESKADQKAAVKRLLVQWHPDRNLEPWMPKLFQGMGFKFEENDMAWCACASCACASVALLMLRKAKTPRLQFSSSYSRTEGEARQPSRPFNSDESCQEKDKMLGL